MEHLFNTTLLLNGLPTEYRVVFHDEVYHFFSESSPDAELVVERKEDAWKPVLGDNPELLRSAIESLEKYLLSQH
jgi:hypothetical protein